MRAYNIEVTFCSQDEPKLTVTARLSAIKRQQRKLHRLRLQFCADYVSRLSSCRVNYLTLSKPEQPHQISRVRWRWAEVIVFTGGPPVEHNQSAYVVELAGIEPASRMPSSSWDYSYVNHFSSKTKDVNCFFSRLKSEDINAGRTPKMDDVYASFSGKKIFSHRVIVSATDHWSEYAEDALQNQHPPRKQD